MKGKRREGEKVIQIRKAADKARCAQGTVYRINKAPLQELDTEYDWIQRVKEWYYMKLVSKQGPY